MDKIRPGKELPVLKIGDPVVVQNRQSKRWDKYGVIQERNLKVRKYVVRLSSGLITVRNRKDLRLRYPPKHQNGGTSLWLPVIDYQNDPDKHLKPVQQSSQDNQHNDSDSDSDDEDDYRPNINDTNGEVKLYPNAEQPEIPVEEAVHVPVPKPILKRPKTRDQTQPIRIRTEENPISTPLILISK
ncbi:hypothetical protein LOTGIDRAFT_161028 [Lottia gigantea]|uniref:Uncharacterized protein n=1 Tax=Lottia gigantea TaxID=225164 RepID=V4AD45_LOTGI|nr:hypothetical protein LOTGIDRAFT_161028 [Lottia gigantea]ESO94777.1 hypothetical protein LOTGIDRAFT_161028 [Lottia gigantea]